MFSQMFRDLWYRLLFNYLSFARAVIRSTGYASLHVSQDTTGRNFVLEETVTLASIKNVLSLNKRTGM